ncbi:MAG: AbrB/MazE/SpoVT family DNA-binding domain-containing protein [Candidatus Pacearchaeota archaeon]|nr:AbrB/MazE/SpoVT family DNA-binding domain-containing protein [Candidatus Pacearchaeota archaeon]
MVDKIEVTSISSRGQVVIPQEIRERLNIHSGEKFVIIGEANTILLKKLEMPSFNEFEKILKKTREFAKEKNIKESDVEEAIKRARKK